MRIFSLSFVRHSSVSLIIVKIPEINSYLVKLMISREAYASSLSRQHVTHSSWFCRAPTNGVETVDVIIDSDCKAVRVYNHIRIRRKARRRIRV